jgi:hypothetical protein
MVLGLVGSLGLLVEPGELALGPLPLGHVVHHEHGPGELAVAAVLTTLVNRRARADDRHHPAVPVDEVVLVVVQRPAGDERCEERALRVWRRAAVGVAAMENVVEPAAEQLRLPPAEGLLGRRIGEGGAPLLIEEEEGFRGVLGDHPQRLLGGLELAMGLAEPEVLLQHLLEALAQILGGDHAQRILLTPPPPAGWRPVAPPGPRAW